MKVRGDVNVRVFLQRYNQAWADARAGWLEMKFKQHFGDRTNLTPKEIREYLINAAKELENTLTHIELVLGPNNSIELKAKTEVGNHIIAFLRDLSA